jgi:hypothetical protein
MMCKTHSGGIMPTVTVAPVSNDLAHTIVLREILSSPHVLKVTQLYKDRANGKDEKYKDSYTGQDQRARSSLPDNLKLIGFNGTKINEEKRGYQKKIKKISLDSSEVDAMDVKIRIDADSSEIQALRAMGVDPLEALYDNMHTLHNRGGFFLAEAHKKTGLLGRANPDVDHYLLAMKGSIYRAMAQDQLRLMAWIPGTHSRFYVCPHGEDYKAELANPDSKGSLRLKHLLNLAQPSDLENLQEGAKRNGNKLLAGALERWEKEHADAKQDNWVQRAENRMRPPTREEVLWGRR